MGERAQMRRLAKAFAIVHEGLASKKAQEKSPRVLMFVE